VKQDGGGWNRTRNEPSNSKYLRESVDEKYENLSNSRAPIAPCDSDLAKVIDTWSDLSEVVRTGILAMVEASDGKSRQ
jgi:hypothetical protein